MNIIKQHFDYQLLTDKFKNRTLFNKISRILLLSSFFEDAIRILFNILKHSYHLSSIWNLSIILWIPIMITVAISQIICGYFIIKRNKVYFCVNILIVSTIFQAIVYQYYYYLGLLFRILSILGSLLFIIVDENFKNNQRWDSVLQPTSPTSRQDNYFKLFGRLMLLLLFATTFHWNSGIIGSILDIVGLLLIILFIIGYKTSICSICLCVWIGGVNLIFNSFWAEEDPQRADLLRYLFFQNITVIGALMILYIHGPGKISLDERKKRD